MPLPSGEPDSPEAVARWIEQHVRPLDAFRDVYAASHRHRESHGPGCSVFPTGSGPLLGVLAAALGAGRILEVGCGLGYSALWLAHGSGPNGRVDTVERDPTHAELARGNFQRAGLEKRVEVLVGDALEVLASLEGPYDLVFSDSDPEDFPEELDHFLRLFRPGGLLVSANLFLGQYVPDLRGVEPMARYRERLLSEPRLRTTILRDGLALSLRR
jgi:predicted O-methyltransferase YrrM